jgi:hypothetical protein
VERRTRESARVSRTAKNETALVEHDSPGERMKPADVDRLLRSAANTPGPSPVEAPFGFDTRVVASLRSGAPDVANDPADLSRFLRRAGLIACAVLVLAGASAYRQYRDEAIFAAGPANEYAIADSAIQTEFSQ